MIYFAQSAAGGGPIRIGCSENPYLRMKTLGSWIIGGVEIIATVPGGYFRERVLHGLLNPIRLEKDWFRSCSAIWRLLIDIEDGGTVDWLPDAAPAERPTVGDIIEIFGSTEAAYRELGYASHQGFLQAVNAITARDQAIAARLWIRERLLAKAVPTYIAGLHGAPLQVRAEEAA